jgi:hypothetical protein
MITCELFDLEVGAHLRRILIMPGFLSKRLKRGSGLGGASRAVWNAFQRSGGKPKTLPVRQGFCGTGKRAFEHELAH